MIIGLTGTLAAGKGVVSDFLQEEGFFYFSLSKEVREIAKERNIKIIRTNLQNLGNKLREEQGSGVLAKIVSNKIVSGNYNKVIVDGIRNPAEIYELRNLEDFYLISVDSPTKTRFKRMFERNRESDPRTWGDFLKIDARDKGMGESETGQGVLNCMKHADYNLDNSGTLEEMQTKVLRLYESLKQT